MFSQYLVLFLFFVQFVRDATFPKHFVVKLQNDSRRHSKLSTSGKKFGLGHLVVFHFLSSPKLILPTQLADSNFGLALQKLKFDYSTNH